VAPRNLIVWVEESRGSMLFPEVKTVHGKDVALGLGSGPRRGDRGVEDGAALHDFDGALRHDPPNIFQRRAGVAPGRPHVRLANVEGPFGHKLAPPRAILREGGPFGDSLALKLYRLYHCDFCVSMSISRPYLPIINKKDLHAGLR